MNHSESNTNNLFTEIIVLKELFAFHINKWSKLESYILSSDHIPAKLNNFVIENVMIDECTENAANWSNINAMILARFDNNVTLDADCECF